MRRASGETFSCVAGRPSHRVASWRALQMEARPASVLPATPKPRGGWPPAALCALALSWVGPAWAQSGSYEFLAAPQTNLNRIYRLDRTTGEVGACQYALNEGTIGVTLCYAPGEGATAQVPGQYALVSSRHDQEAGVFRVDLRTGMASICYVSNETVVCTPPAK